MEAKRDEVLGADPRREPTALTDRAARPASTGSRFRRRSRSGRVNCYLLEGEPLTLVDTGPNSGTALDRLERGLAEHGFRIEDLELIVLTHQHMDHEGLLEIVARRSGAEVAAFAPLAPWLADYRASADRRRRLRAGGDAPPRAP